MIWKLKSLNKIAKYFAILLVLFLLFCAWLGYTQSGLNFAYTMSKKFLPGNLIITNLHGKLLTNITFTSLQYEDTTIKLNATNTHLSWNGIALLWNGLWINDLTADNIAIIIKPQKHSSNESARSFSNYSLHIKNFNINALAIYTKDLNMQIEKLAGAFRYYQTLQNAKLSFSAAQIQTQQQYLALNRFEFYYDQKTILFGVHAIPNRQLIKEYKVDLTGTQKDNQLNLRLSASEKNQPLLTGTGTVFLAPNLGWAINLEGQHVNLSDFLLSVVSNLNFKFNSQMHFENGKLQGFNKLINVNGTLGEHHIQGSSSINFSPEKNQIDTEIISGNNHIEIHGEIINQWNLKWNIDLQNLHQYLPDLSGTIILNGKFSGSNTTPLLTGNIILNNFSSQHYLPYPVNLTANFSANFDFEKKLSLQKFNFNFHNAKIKFEKYLSVASFNLTALADKNNLNINSKLELSSNNFIISNIYLLSPTLKKIKNQTQSLTGNLQIHFNQLNFLNAFVDSPLQINGNLTGNASLSGNIMQPNYRGNFTLLLNHLVIPEINTQIDAANINAKFANDSKLQLSGNINILKNIVTLVGRIDLNNPFNDFYFKINGNNLEIINNSEYQIYVSPDLTLTTQNNNFIIKGIIFIPKAILRPHYFGSNVVSLSDDVQFVEEENKFDNLLQRLSGEITLTLGDQVSLNTFGLTGKVIGSTKIHFAAGTTTTALGEFHLAKGDFQAYGQKLDVRRGKLFFTGGSLLNPNIEAEATRTLLSNQLPTASLGNFSMPTSLSFNQRIIVGVRITGTIDHHQINLFSEPGGFSQSDILSMLILGKPVSDVSSGNAQSLLQAASSLNVSGGSLLNITQELQNAFGIDQISIESLPPQVSQSATDNTAVVLGKRISKNLYLSYSYGIFDPVSIVQATYALSSKWSIQTQASSLGSGIDIFYTIETGKDYREHNHAQTSKQH